MGPIDPPAYGGFNYIGMLTCRATGKTWIYLLKTKDEWYGIIKDVFLPLLKTQTPNHRVKRWRSDEGSEQANKRFQAMLAEEGIIWEPSAPYAKEQNGIAERKNLTIMNSVRAIMDDAGLPWFLWGEIAKTSIYLYNRRPVARLRVQNVTPEEAYTNIKPDISHYRMIGCDAWLAISKDQKDQKKLSPRGVKCKLVGYAGTNQYRLYNPVTKRCITARDVEFDESSMLNRKHTAVYWDGPSFEDFVPSGGDIQSNDTDGVSDNPGQSEDPVQEIARLDARIKELSLRESLARVTDDVGDNDSLPPLPEDQSDLDESDDNIGDDERVLHPDPHPDSTIGARPLESEVTLGRGSRHREPSTRAKQTERWADPKNWGKVAKVLVDEGHYERLCEESQAASARMVIVSKSQEAYDHDFDPEGDFNDLIQLAQAYSAKTRPLVDEEPLTLKEALNGPYAKEFKGATDVEMAGHKAMGTYKRVKRSSLPPNAKILSSRLVFKVKKNLDGDIIKFKARWCARGFEQSHGIDFHDTYASVVKSMTYKLLFAMIAHHDLDAEQMDIVTAFLNARLKERNIFIEPPESYEDPEYVWVLARALYGLKQSPREWYETLSRWLIS